MKLHTLILKRALQLIALAFLVTSATFFLASLVPGDFFTVLEANPNIRPERVAQLRNQYGLGDPIYQQYARWLQRSLKLDFGYSLYYGEPVASKLKIALTNTLWVGLPALIIGLSVGVFWGTVHAIYHDRLLGFLLDIFSTTLLSLPSIILGLLALLLASHTLWFPIGSMSSPDLESASFATWILDRLHHLVLPVMCLCLPLFAYVERIQNASSLSLLGELPLRSARSRGLRSDRIFCHYLLRPSLNPVLSTMGPLFGVLLSGSLVLEYIFNWQGLGMVTYHALMNRDIFLLLGCVTCGSLFLLLGNLIADLLLYLVDPRTRESACRATL